LSIIEQNTRQIFAQSEREAKKIIYLKIQRMPVTTDFAVAFSGSIAVSIERNMRCNAAVRDGNSPFTMSRDSSP
jgi:hypothetical protein